MTSNTTTTDAISVCHNPMLESTISVSPSYLTRDTRLEEDVAELKTTLSQNMRYTERELSAHSLSLISARSYSEYHVQYCTNALRILDEKIAQENRAIKVLHRKLCKTNLLLSLSVLAFIILFGFGLVSCAN